MVSIVCINAGNYLGQGRNYVERLFDMVRRNLAEGYPGRFICFTDDPEPYTAGIEKRPLPDPSLNGWWSKLGLFRPGVFEDGERVLYFDLDTLIVGDIQALADYEGEFAILRDFYRPDGLQSSVMAWRGGFGAPLYEEYVADGCPAIDGGDQAWIEFWQPDADIWQQMLPDAFVSYKVTAGRVPKRASVVVFHGEPRIHTIQDGWVPQVWKIGGISRADLTVICNTETDRIIGNVASASKRDLPWFDFAKDHDRKVCIVGGGPSLHDTLPELCMLNADYGHEVWATNGTHDYLIERGIFPDACVILDARSENAAFVSRPVHSVTYYVASQCDPAVFDALNGYDVVVYHNASEGVEDYLSSIDLGDRPTHLFGGGTTVGMKAIVLARHAGFQHFHLFGCDSSYRGDDGHAYDQPLNAGERVVNAICGDVTFQAAPWMVQQVEDFQSIATMFVSEGCTFVVSGDGLLPHVARQMAVNPAILAFARRGDSILSRLPQGRPVVGAEIGVFSGALSSYLLRARGDLTLYMVDSWEGRGAGYQSFSGDWHAKLSQAEQDAYAAAAQAGTEFAGDRARIIRKRSSDAAGDVADGSLDFVFIDADHSYEGCRDDIAAWLPKLKPDGLLCGHDYGNKDFPGFGVDRAVDEFAAKSGLGMELGDNFTWFIRLGEAQAQAA